MLDPEKSQERIGNGQNTGRNLLKMSDYLKITPLHIIEMTVFKNIEERSMGNG